jgi:hypothetical protein
MKKPSLLFMMPCFIAMAAAWAAAPDFSGTWTVNLTRSNAGDGPRFFPGKFIITQSDSMLIVNRFFEGENGEFSMTDSLTLNGKEHALAGMFNSKRNVSASLVQDTLLIRSKIAFERDGETSEMTSTDKWTLKEDGKILAVDVKTVSSWGELDLSLVYDKAVAERP